MTIKAITNAVALELPANKSAEAGRPLVIQLAPVGEYPQTIEDASAEGGQRTVVQKVDAQAIDALISNFKDKVLVDADHSSETSTNTRAMAWVTRLFKDPDKGLMAEIEPTSEGADKINGKVYRFVSAAWVLDDDDRPQELVSVGLTNKPNLPVAPMLNSQAVEKASPGTVADADGMTDDAPSAAANADGGDADKNQPPATADDSSSAEGEKTKTPTTNQEGNQSMDIKAKLGLPPEATDEEVEQAIDALIVKCGVVEEVQNALGLEGTATNEETMEALNAVINSCGELQARNAEMEEAKLNAEADDFVAQNGDVIPEEAVESLKEEYKADPEAAQQTVANFRLVAKKAVANAQPPKATVVSTTPAKTRVRVDNSQAKRPVALNMADALAKCGGDPAKENEIIRQMVAQGINQ